jgi:hypothetical protein
VSFESRSELPLVCSTIMAFVESDNMCIVNKFNGNNFSLLKFKMKMILDKIELWNIIEGSEEALQVMLILR